MSDLEAKKLRCDNQHREHVQIEPFQELHKEQDGTHLDLQPTSSDYQAVERRVLRKLDRTLMPTVWFLYFCNYLDRNNIS